MSKITSSTPCPCDSGRPYHECCQSCHDGTQPAATAEALMRSRYCAYTLELWRYLYNTWDPQTRPTRKSLANSESTQWQGLDIIATHEGGSLNDTGSVEFKAHWKDAAGQPQSLHENSRFRRHGGKWVYVDGEMLGR